MVTLLEHLNLKGEPLYYQHVTLALHERLLCTKFKFSDVSSATNTVEFTYEEENTVVRYMGGYVTMYLDAQSSDWINAIDQGGLVHITDACFQLFIAIEINQCCYE